MPRVNDGLQSLAELNKNPVEGFSAGLIDDNDLYRWEVLIIGPPDTLYEGGVFKAYLIFPKDYPLRPPKTKFITDIWPPNGKLPLIWNKIKTGWSSLVPDTGKLSWPRQQSSVRKNSGSVSNHGTGRSPFHPGANIQLEWQYYQNKILKGEAGTHECLKAMKETLMEENNLTQEVAINQEEAVHWKAVVIQEKPISDG
ncbi:probable ubiquitin-conjugating enzyme E2 C [Apodemus sylvaticus]|uniref:probable ubiquitin-conjugating enzyme E2 C n=1 Tax=Apodemus sylvaticus TaxID=10129 RepID=UPI0022441FEE|nr:probable ubiquitin-conjugating enzyme E2 C [Apodemus sylvaticus]